LGIKKRMAATGFVGYITGNIIGVLLVFLTGLALGFGIRFIKWGV